MPVKVYHLRVQRPDGSFGWQGGPDLAKSAEFTGEFCAAIRKCWENRHMKRVAFFSAPKFEKSCEGKRHVIRSKQLKKQKKSNEGAIIPVRRSQRLAEKARRAK